MNTEKKQKRAGLGVALMIAGGLLVLSALSLFLYNDMEDRRASEAATLVADALALEIEERAAEAGSELSPAAPAAPAAPETTPSPDVSETGPSGDAPEAGGGYKTITIDGEQYIGLLRIPALGLSLPVMRDWSYERLKISPCRYSGSVDEDTIVIAAHNYKRHFGNIHLLSYGDALTFTDAQGVTTEYTVAEIETLEATAVTDMTQSGYALTLFTCTYGGAARVALRFVRSASSVL
ncbi:MAG: sortase [Oscillospiraceae bacterium]|jgi:sortase A|nr:sortase [Oscillospiraceae bacterium]